VIRLAGPDRALELFDVRLVGFDAVTLRKLALTIAFFVGVTIIAAALRAVARLLTRGDNRRHTRFVAQQTISLCSTFLLVLVFISIWFDNPARFASAAALVTAGLAVALQKLIMSMVGYFAILRGNSFRIGDRITMGGVRGDVVALGYIRTTIMEMGQPPAVQSDPPGMWVSSWQYTGRIVTVTNDKIFDTPVYNFTRDFPYLYDEIHLPIKYTADRARAERILLDAAEKHTVSIRELGQHDLDELSHRYFMRKRDDAQMSPRVYWRLTDNWLEMTVRFLARDHGTRELKDAMSREILARLDEAGVAVASSTVELVGVPTLKLADGRERHAPL
jgi:small-conductance mechanosensitive channel